MKQVFVTLYCNGRKITGLLSARQEGKSWVVDDNHINFLLDKIGCRRGDAWSFL